MTTFFGSPARPGLVVALIPAPPPFVVPATTTLQPGTLSVARTRAPTEADPPLRVGIAATTTTLATPPPPARAALESTVVNTKASMVDLGQAAVYTLGAQVGGFRGVWRRIDRVRRATVDRSHATHVRDDAMAARSRRVAAALDPAHT